MGISGWLRRRGKKEEKDTAPLGTDALEKRRKRREAGEAASQEDQIINRRVLEAYLPA